MVKDVSLKRNLYIIILMVVVVPLAGELKMYPFPNSFRISFGIPIFFLLLLAVRRIPIVLCGMFVGIAVVVFRMALDLGIRGELFQHSFTLHFPTFFYYVAYSYMFYITRLKDFQHHPLTVGALSVIIETTASVVELSIRHYFLGDMISLFILNEVVMIAIIRSFFALGFFYAIKLHEAEVSAMHQQKQNQHMLLLISSLYEESIQLKKSLKDAEKITRDCYDLYENLLNNKYSLSADVVTQKILGLAGQVHEIKKDNQRIYAGLAQLISAENSTDYMNVAEIGNIIIQTNHKYAQVLKKDIQFDLDIGASIPPLHIYTTLSLVNNLVSNAVEAIKDTGLVKISVHRNADYIKFKIFDTGEGISKRKTELIFKPGYTTKYDTVGNPSTGMGLPYVKEVVTNLQGCVFVESSPEKKETVFTIELPVSSLVEKG